MSILTNKHFVIALIVAPILAVISYFAVDAMVAEKAQAPVSGHSYQLVAQSNCRYNSGRCVLKNGNFELKLEARWLRQGTLSLVLESEHPLDGIKVATVPASGLEATPESMKVLDIAGQRWQLDLDSIVPDQDRLQLVARANNALYFAEASMAFTLEETTN